MSHVIDTTEMYLRTVYELLEEGVPPLRARIAERMQHSGPTVSQTVARMERDGLLTVHEDRRILLSAEGERLAVQVMRRHRLAERLLVDVIKLEWAQAHDEACKWEHVVGEAVEAKLVTLLNDPVVSPFGAPIPRQGESVETSIARFREGAGPLGQSLGVQVRLVRIGEYLQRDIDALEALWEAGIVPETTLTAECDDTKLTLYAGDNRCALDAVWADQLFVAV
ncbi:MAG: metal-dependent transcriptional regulator [Propionibacteriaceae bacterium]|jgi:DtxR family Mn-dependent transcriptional regulator|nr:metal-dependent transcriptional regulator [Propionibacteriaceae bacterium]